ncbi:protein NKG7-like [Paroedura picta]|uniref:protein NKG7-like n=1 Tax=Paroedura picta TaxID=143630 RepID=UPI0040564194
MDGLKFSALICCFISIVLLVIVLTTSDWVEANEHAGLWIVCNDTRCNPVGMQMQGYIHATRALLIIGLIAGTVSFIDLCASFGHAYFTAGSWTKFTSKASFFAGLSVLAALGTFTGGYFVSGVVALKSLGWTYGLGWVPAPLFFITDWLAHRIHTRGPK